MAVKILIKRVVPEITMKEVLPLLIELRSLASKEPGYISGETLRRLDTPEEFLVISTWRSHDDWKKWMGKKKRKEIINTLNTLLGTTATYEVYHYGF